MRADEAVRHDDADAISDLVNLVAISFDPFFREGWSAGQIIGQLALPGTHWSVLHDAAAQPIGFTLTRELVDEEELLLLAVHPDHRGKGHGATLVGMWIDSAQARNMKRLFLEMRRNNPAERLYRNHGFSPVGRRPDYYRCLDGSRIDAITFARDY